MREQARIPEVDEFMSTERGRVVHDSHSAAPLLLATLCN